VAEVRA